jgi:hypothetical protein
MLIHGFPSKISELFLYVDEDGHNLIRIGGIDIFYGKEHENQYPASHMVDVPEIIHTDYDVVGFPQPIQLDD